MIGKDQQDEISLYFHIPFCTRKCDYCHFYVLPDQEANKDKLLEGFKLEWQRLFPLIQSKKLKTIYFGGGTPSLFGPSRLDAVLQLVTQKLCTSEQLEITLEANPENISLDLMKDYRSAGINRVSIGIQTLDDRLLQLLGRLHKADTALRAVHQTAEAGIHNISIDLMYDLPKQTLQHWETTLASVRSLPITHLSLYNLTIEPHTLFFKKQATLKQMLPDEEASLSMYLKAVEELEIQGLKRYEISAFAMPGYESKHNVGYWMARPFLGLGPSAFSYWEGSRFRNISHLNRYCQFLIEGQSPVDFHETLDPVAHLRELLTIQLRLCQGVSLSEFQETHGQLDKETYQTMQSLIAEGFLEIKANRLFLTPRGILFYDTVASELI